jgi:hypothetical protein
MLLVEETDVDELELEAELEVELEARGAGGGGAERKPKLHVYARNLYVRVNGYPVLVCDEGRVHVEAGADITAR